jgi:hypothetical protein
MFLVIKHGIFEHLPFRLERETARKRERIKENKEKIIIE